MTQKLATAQYDSFTATRTRKSVNGLMMLAQAAPFPAPASVVAAHGGIEYDIIAFVAVRRGLPPEVPAPYSSNANRVYLTGQQSAAFPVRETTGVMNYVLAGFYIFGILAPEGLESDFMIGNLPFPGADTDERYPAGFLNYSLINQTMTRLVPGIGNQVPTLPPLERVIRDLQNRNG